MRVRESFLTLPIQRKIKYMRALILLLCSFVIVSCTTTPQTKPVQVEEQIETVQIEDTQKWTDDQKNYWITLYFTRMSFDPNVRHKYPPENLYNLCKCIMDVLSHDYDYETFITDFNKQPVDPMNAQIVYDVSFKCSMEEVRLMQEQYKMNLENSI